MDILIKCITIITGLYDPNLKSVGSSINYFNVLFSNYNTDILNVIYVTELRDNEGEKRQAIILFNRKERREQLRYLALKSNIL